MAWFKLKWPQWSKLAWWMIAGLILVPIVDIALNGYFDESPSPVFPVFYFCGVLIYAIVVNRAVQRLWGGIKAVWRDKTLDAGWLRWLITFIAITTGVIVANFRELSWLILPAVAVFGVATCLYFGHLLLFRLQCGLLELLAITTAFGLIDGLLLSTPGAMRLGLYLSPVVAAWILYGAVSGLVRARLLNENGPRARMAHMVVALFGSSALALFVLGIAIILSSRAPALSMGDYQAWGWPLAVIGFIGFFLDIGLNVKTQRRAKALSKPAPEPGA